MLTIILFIIIIYIIYIFSAEDFDIMNPYYKNKLPLSYVENNYTQIDNDYTIGNINNLINNNYVKNDNSIDIFKNRIILEDKPSLCSSNKTFSFIGTVVPESRTTTHLGVDNLKKNIDKDSSKICTLVSIINTDNGQYEYKYEKYYNEECDINKFELNDNNQLFFSDINDNIGSCRHFFYECNNFTTPEECKKFNTSSRKFLTWSPKTCYDKITFDN